ncbi:LysR family transcriptional regulator [Planotetraspora kaengkrachanensis]|uniref:LysR family transcriptional regulator n=1 Tax=Planotetraspora kaengkrachanensis TaxID=575193 RepID=A0A8J3PTN5_9ACTN|nr:LysR family transcriptional regulator [Planotetraspora kaengkrachanensis]GIG80471.1 LysR family transcriptional regulator [Planotetraspora kaengkrachanensis]
MELRHLEYFVAVAEELNFTRAARRLHVVQSGVSAAIRSLEREMGVTLFDRTSQRVVLSDAGAALLPEARATLDAARAAREAVQAVGQGLRGTVNIGSMTSVHVVDLPGLLGRFRQEHPGVTIRIRVAPSGSAGLAQALVSGELDVAFLSLPGPPPTGVALRRLAVVPLVLVVRADHPLAGERSVPLARIVNEEFIDFPPGYGNRAVVDRAFAAAGAERRVTAEVHDIATGAAFVRHGLGVAFLPEFAVPDTRDIAALSVSDVTLTWSLSVATVSTRRPNAAVRALLDLVDQHVSDTTAVES